MYEIHSKGRRAPKGNLGPVQRTIDLLFFTALNAVFRFCNQLSGVRSAISDKEWPDEVSEEVDIDNHVDSLRTGQRLTYLE